MNRKLTALTVLVLTRKWQATETIAPIKALSMMFAGVAFGIDIDAEGKVLRSVDWKEWSKLPVRDDDAFVQVVGDKIRLPTVMLLRDYNDMRDVAPRFSPENVRKREGDRCFYSKRKLRVGEGNLDHVHPRSRGGGKNWNNIVYCDRRINSAKANRTPEEAGLKVERVPATPPSVPKFLTIENTLNIPDWERFLVKSAKAGKG